MTEGTGPTDRSSLALALRLIRTYLNGEYVAVVAGVSALVAASALALLEPWPLKLVVDSVLGDVPAPPILAATMAMVSQVLPPLPDALVLLTILCAATILLRLVLGLVRLAADYLLIGVGLRMVFRLRCAVFNHVQRLSLVFHDSNPVGDSLYRVAWDTYSIQTVFNNGLIQLLTASTTVVGIGVIMFSRDWVLSAAAVAFGLPMILILRRVDGPIRRRSNAVNEHESAVTTRVQETLSGIRVVQAFSGESRESGRFQERAALSARASLRLNMAQSASGLVVGLGLAAGTAAVVWVASYRVLAGSLTTGDVVLIAAYVAMLYRPLEAFAYTATTVQRASSGAKRVFDVLDTPSRISDVTSPAPLPARVTGRLTFDHVRFAYNDDRAVLDDVSFVVEPGTRVAVVGASGVGKTTVASLLVRFYDPTEGRILMDDVDIKTVSLASLRSQMAIVLQEPILFGATVRENIAYGKPEADKASIVRAARAAGAHAFIEALPGGYDFPIGERGVFLSGGQRQRIAIARAFLKDAPILIMDEPTSALDTETEAGLLVALEALMRGRTSVIIAHRLSTVRTCDNILVFQQGRVTESGSHEALLARRGHYADLYYRQFPPRMAAAIGHG